MTIRCSLRCPGSNLAKAASTLRSAQSGLGAHDLSTHDRDLMARDQDLRILGGVTARQQHPPAKHPDHEEVDEAEEHERRA